ncbi:MAG: hypothetical protein ACI9SQ_001153 [Rubritalea sp.]|jgi:hypothetical protein
MILFKSLQIFKFHQFPSYLKLINNVLTNIICNFNTTLDVVKTCSIQQYLT